MYEYSVLQLIGGTTVIKVKKGYSKLLLLDEIRSAPRIQKIRIYEDKLTKEQIDTIFEPINKTDYLAVDFETRGLKPTDDSFLIAGLGLGYRTGSVYFNFFNLDNDTQNHILAKLTKFKCLAHNVPFDGWVYYNRMGKHLNWICTYALYGYLANDTTEWGLKSAMVRVLGWEDSNEKDLDEWLINNGWVKGSGGVKNVDEIDRLKKIERIKYRREVEGAEYKPDKAEMWRAPPKILGHYCALDAEATYFLYKKVLHPASVKYKFTAFFTQVIMVRIIMQVEFLETGMWVDRKMLAELEQTLLAERKNQSEIILDSPQVAPFVKAHNERIIQEQKDKEPEKYLKTKEVGEEPEKFKKEPKKYSKTGKILKEWERWSTNQTPTARWLAWSKRYNDSQNKTVSKNWVNWAAKLKEVQNTNHFLLTSPQQLSALLYKTLFEVETIRPYVDKQDRGSFWLKQNNKRIVELEHTKNGAYPTDKIALSWMGEIGKLVLPFKYIIKELEFTSKTLKLSDKDGILRPGTRIPGTLTGRGAGNNPNFQQIIKSPRVLACYKPRPGNVWIQFDFDALENKLLAEFSRDPNLLELYGPDAKPHCGYMFFGMEVPEYKEAFVAAGYDPDNPTKEGVAAAKAACKPQRSACKVAVLLKQYGGGVEQLFKTLTLAKLDVTKDFAATLHAAYDKKYPGVKALAQKLNRQVRSNGNILMNATGRPLAITPKKQKDLINTLCQSSGVDRLHILLTLIDKRLIQQQIPGCWAYLDFHDELCYETSPSFVDQVKGIFVNSLNELNSLFDEIVPLTGTPEVHYNLATIKCE